MNLKQVCEDHEKVCMSTVEYHQETLVLSGSNMRLEHEHGNEAIGQ